MTKQMTLKVLAALILVALFWPAVCFGMGKYCHGDSVTLEIPVHDSTFWAMGNPDSFVIAWGTFSGSAAPARAGSSSVIKSANWTNWKIAGGSFGTGLFVYKVAASQAGTDSSYSCWAACVAYKGGNTGTKMWSWWVGNCKEDSILAELDTVDNKIDSLAHSDSLTLFPTEKPGRLFESFDDSSDFTYGGNGTYYVVPHNRGFGVREGQGAIELIATEDDSCYMYRACGTAVTLGTYMFRDIETVSFWVCLNKLSQDNALGGDYDLDLDGLDIKLTNDGGAPGTWDSYYEMTLEDTVLTAGWQHIILHIDQFNAVGVISGSDTLGGIYFGIKTDAGGDSLGVIFDNFRFNRKDRPVVMIMFDDGHESIYDLGYSYLHDEIDPPMPAHLMLLVVDLDNASSLTYTELRTMREGGWDICNHCMTTTIFTGLTPTVARDHVLRASRIIEDTLTPGIDLNLEFNTYEWFGAYPSGRYDQDIIDMLRDEGFWAWRTTVTGRTCQGHPDYPGGDEWFRLKSHYLHSTPDTTGNMTASIDTCIMRGGLLLLMYHSLLDDQGEGGHQFDTSTVYPAWRYLAAKRDSGFCDVMTLSEYFEKVRTARHYQLNTYDAVARHAEADGGWEGCYERLFPEDGSASKDSLYVICPFFGADSIRYKKYFNPPDSQYYDEAVGVHSSRKSPK